MSTIKNAMVGGMIAVALTASAGSLLAAGPGWGHSNPRHSNAVELREDYARLAAARAKLAYDLRYHASRSKVAQDRARIQAILDEIERDRRYGWNQPRGWGHYERGHR